MKIEDVINRDDLRERLDGDMDLYCELVDIFLEDSDVLLSAIEDAIKAKDSEKVGKNAHTIKGAVSNFSAQKAFEAALALEKIGKNDEFDKIPAAFERLKKEIETAKEAMKLLKEEDAI